MRQRIRVARILWREQEKTELEKLTDEILDSPAREWITRCLMELRDFGFDPADPDILRKAITRGEKLEAAKNWRDVIAANPKQFRDDRLYHPPVVYYMQMGELVKIGFTERLYARVRDINPQRVLAVEFGDRKVESVRHHDFASLRSHGEWFHLRAPLVEFIELAKRRFSAQVGMPADEWIETRVSQPAVTPEGPFSHDLSGAA